MQDLPARVESPATSPLEVRLASHPGEVLAAQRLRYRVFGLEQGARLQGAERGLDRDEFDAHCDHLIALDTSSGEVVGTYRMLPPARARALGRFYSEGEFDLTALAPLRDRTLEVGRSCVHPDYRTGATIARLWSGLARHVLESGVDYLMGCASIAMTDGGVQAHRIYGELCRTALAPEQWRVSPRVRLPGSAPPAGADDTRVRVAMPPLLKGYQRLGAWVCGEPAWDPAFGCADLLLLLPVSRIASRYAHHFLKPLDAAA
ncbi:MAG: GNAT family N-acetyltransferase [Pseudomonadota bacterium]|jgi:putative hemolysin